jgi:hypothetical protein
MSQANPRCKKGRGESNSRKKKKQQQQQKNKKGMIIEMRRMNGKRGEVER